MHSQLSKERLAAARAAPPLLAPALVALLAPHALSQESQPAPSQEARLRRLEAEFEAYKKSSETERAALREEVGALRARLDHPESSPSARAIDDAIAELEANVGSLTQRQTNLEAASSQRVAYLNISFDLLVAAGTSQATDAEIPALEDGTHDPNTRGFTLQNAELFLDGAVDPNFRGAANIVLQIDPAGETLVELEEAYFVTTSLPGSLQIKAGEYFTEFGRMNMTHPHQWDFVDQPLVTSRIFGPDHQRSVGARASWLAPTDFFLELIGGIQNPRGETIPSFYGNDGLFDPFVASSGAAVSGSLGGYPYVTDQVKNLGDLLYTTRASASFDAGDESTFLVGASGLFGPNSTGNAGNTQIVGLDFTYRWRALESDQGWPFVSVQSEYLWRRYYAAAFSGDADGDTIPEVLPSKTFHDDGFYAQLVWGFARPWSVAGRFEWEDGNGASTAGDPTLDRRLRGSASLTYYPSEFSRIRVQGNLDRSQIFDDRNILSVWLQFEILFGAHAAHKF